MAIWLGVFFLLVPFFVIMVLESRRKRPIREEECAEEEGESGEHEATETPTKHDQSQTPLWKYVQRQEGGKGGGTTKFLFPHCNNEYIGSYTRARRHLCGKMPGDGEKNLGIIFKLLKNENFFFLNVAF